MGKIKIGKIIQSKELAQIGVKIFSDRSGFAGKILPSWAIDEALLPGVVKAVSEAFGLPSCFLDSS